MSTRRIWCLCYAHAAVQRRIGVLFQGAIFLRLDQGRPLCNPGAFDVWGALVVIRVSVPNDGFAIRGQRVPPSSAVPGPPQQDDLIRASPQGQIGAHGIAYEQTSR